MKKILFWLAFVPIGVWIIGIGCIWGILDFLCGWTDRWTHRFEAWCFDQTVDEYYTCKKRGFE